MIGNWYPRDRNIDTKPVEGSIVGYEFRPWRVIDIRRDVEHPDYPGRLFTVLRLRPIDATVVEGSNRDIHVGGTSGYRFPQVLSDHYALCVRCGDLMPCREQVADRVIERMRRKSARYEIPGVCPACGEPVTERQKSTTLANTVIPSGPPVTFHAGRHRCRDAMERYLVEGMKHGS